MRRKSPQIDSYYSKSKEYPVVRYAENWKVMCFECILKKVKNERPNKKTKPRTNTESKGTT